MKKIISLCLSACLLICGFVMNSKITFAQGGVLAVDFSTADAAENFNFYSELYGHGFYLSDGYLCSSGRTENKAILKSPTALTQYTVEADFHKVNEIAPIDAGFYIHASSATGVIDDIIAYNVNVEKPIKSNNVTIKIHRFQNSYLGELLSVGLTVKSYPVKLKVCVDHENVKVFVNNGKNPVIDTNLPQFSVGSVGIRAFRGSPAKISNFKLTTHDLPANTTILNQTINKAEQISDLSIYTTNSATAFSNALKQAKEVPAINQSDVDLAVKRLVNAMNELVLKSSFEQLTEKIATAENIIKSGNGIYTYNTFTALKMVAERAKKVTENSSEDKIAKFNRLLDNAINNLVKYKK